MDPATIMMLAKTGMDLFGTLLGPKERNAPTQQDMLMQALGMKSALKEETPPTQTPPTGIGAMMPTGDRSPPTQIPMIEPMQPEIPNVGQVEGPSLGAGGDASAGAMEAISASPDAAGGKSGISDDMIMMGLMMLPQLLQMFQRPSKPQRWGGERHVLSPTSIGYY